MPNTGQALSTAIDVRPALRHDRWARYVFEDFRGMITASAAGTPFGDPTGSEGDVNNLFTGRNVLQYHVVTAASGAQTILGPVRTATGLNITQDLTDDDGVEYTLGCEAPAGTLVGAYSRGNFKVGDGNDPPFFMSLKFKLADVSGTDDCAVGFRKNEIYQALVDNYDEMACLNVISGDIKAETILNNAATTTTDSEDNWADAATKTLTVIVDSDGTLFGTARGVYYEIDGVKPTKVPSTLFKFDADEVVIPFFYFKNASDVAETTELIEWESGFVGVGQTTQLAGQ